MSEHERGSIEWYREQFPPGQNEWKPASMQPGSDRAAFFWIAYFVVFGLLVLYLGLGL